jgi:hypothetical protein
MDREEKKLMEEIRNGLRDFEIPYEEGSWEKFHQMYQAQTAGKQVRMMKKPAYSWKYIPAAAALIGALLYLPWHGSERVAERKNPVVIHVEAPATSERTTPPAKAESRSPMRSALRPAMSLPAEDRVYAITEQMAGHTAAEQAREQDRPVAEVNDDATATKPLNPAREAKPHVPANRPNETAFAAADQQEESVQASDRWKFGIEINSSIGSDKINLAAGLVTQFQVSEKLRLSTGLNYSTMAAEHTAGPVPLSNDTRMVGGETTIQAIDIPLTVVYEPSEGWFASVGVSALAVLNEDKTLRMESDALQETVMLDPESGAAVSFFEVVTNEYTEKSQDTDFEGRNNLRYLNLSIGKRQRLNKRTEILFEPFLKIPMGDLQRKDINMLNSGIKLKLLF